jgi:hypothetical protein
MLKVLEILFWIEIACILVIVRVAWLNYRRNSHPRKPNKPLHVAILATSLLLAGGCASRTFTLLPEGIPVQQHGDRVLIVFPEMDGNTQRHQSAWFFLPGHGLVSGQEYRIRIVVEPLTLP